ncbi:MAG: arylesterase [Candidatus Lambdaproteobacteria bacterium]|nr:arylesterase [Candidatus Lambdaproteobacteria bacterium]
MSAARELLTVWCGLALLLLVACKTPPAGEQAAPAPAAPAPAAAAATDEPRVIVMLGDSLTAGLGLPEEQSYPALIQRRLDEDGYPWRVVNAGVSGDTTAGGLARLDWVLRQRVDVLLVELGANDGLRGLSTSAMRDNLARIIETAQARDIRVVLAGMRMPTNYGTAYGSDFEAVYAELARTYQVALIPFLLEGVAARGALNQADGIHPNAAGAAIVADTVWRALQPIVAATR